MARGAEATLEKRGSLVIKKRKVKNYRIKEIDGRLRKNRTKKEMRSLNRARRYGINVPKVIKNDLKKMTIEMEFIRGPVLRDKIEKLSENQIKKVCKNIGKEIVKMHKANIIHGDLTTSNMILKDGKNDQVYLIDFGLSFTSPKIEDKAVDLHLLKQALKSKHNKIWKECYKKILKEYEKETEERIAKKIKKRIKNIEKRGRYTNKKL